MKPENIIYKAEPFTGRQITRTYLARTGWQVVAYDKTTGKRRAVFTTGYRNAKTPCNKLGWVACHYRTGRSKADETTYRDMRERAHKLAGDLNN